MIYDGTWSHTVIRLISEIAGGSETKVSHAGTPYLCGQPPVNATRLESLSLAANTPCWSIVTPSGEY